MFRARRVAWGLSAVVAATSLLSCFAITDVDRFHAGEGGTKNEADDPNLPSTLDLTLHGMKPHLDQEIEMRIVDAANYVQCRIIMDPVDVPSEETVAFHVPNAIPIENRPYHLDLYADLNQSGGFDGLPAEGDVLRDHAWRIDPVADFPAGTPHVANVVNVTFQHNVQFTDIGNPAGPGADVLIHFDAARMTNFVGRLLEVRIVHAIEPLQTVAVYRNPSIPAKDFEARLPGMVEPNDDYELDFYIDADGDGQYDPPSGGEDLGWRVSTTAKPAAVAIDWTFDPSQGAGVDVGAP